MKKAVLLVLSTAGTKVQWQKGVDPALLQGTKGNLKPSSLNAGKKTGIKDEKKWGRVGSKENGISGEGGQPITNGLKNE